MPEIASIYYELWKMTNKESLCQKALKYYQMAYEHTPNIEYKKRLEKIKEEVPQVLSPFAL